MRLKRLDLFGFKSFADRTVFDFGDKTLTGVVGPNGCGKSNVVDSIRWVLGETRPTSMRGSEMSDVIFKGSSSRPALSVAEATLVLDNAEGVLDGMGAEVSITRRVFKSGEGEYLLDGERVRLKDIREMLFDTGLGSRGYSVLEQGRIDAVLSANAVERRRIFEEAAGISRYRQRKHETELRLKRVDQDLARLDDVLSELGTRVRSLKIQAGKAERFVTAKEDWSRERERWLRHRLHLYDIDLEQQRVELQGQETGAENLRREREACEGDFAEREREGLNLAGEMERMAGEIARLSGDTRAMEERRTQLSARVDTWRQNAGEERERAQILDSKHAERSGMIEELGVEVERLAREIERGEADLEHKKGEARELDKRYRELRKSSAEQNGRVLELLHRKTEAQNTVKHLTDSRAPADERHERVVERLMAARAAVLTVTQDEEAGLTRVVEFEQKLTDGDGLRREVASKLEIVEQQLSEAEARRARLDIERERTQSQVEFLLDRERDLEALDSEGREILARIEAGDSPVSGHQLLGLVADRLRSGSREARALDAVLRGRAQDLIVEQPAAAERLAAWLAQSGAGQLGLVVRDGLARHTDRIGELAVVRDERVLGPLTRWVECTTGCEALAEALCGDVLLVRDVASGLALVKDYPSLRFVTLEGELVDAAGLRAGRVRENQGAVARRSSAAALQVGLERCVGQIAEIEGGLSRLRDERVELKARLTEHSSEVDILREQLAEAREDLAMARGRREDLRTGELSLEEESLTIAGELQRLSENLVRATEQGRSCETEFQSENTRLEELERARHAMEERREAALREQAAAELFATRTREQSDGLEGRIRELQRALEEVSTELGRAKRLTQEHDENAAKGVAESERLTEEVQVLVEQREGLEKELESKREAAKESREAIEAVRKRSDEVTRHLERAAEEISGRRLGIQREELAREDILVRSQEELELSAEDLTRDFTPEGEMLVPSAMNALDNTVRELKNSLDRLGPVNLEAVSELGEVGQRLEFLTTQRKDLAESQVALRETVRTIDEESRRLFVEAFEEVRGNFQRIFRKLFGGGKADVILEEGLDVLDAGVEIMARPPGRELLPIGLLSGGQRTMTALALLFAVFEARPSPFCVLDEVDAALDDANIDRFIQMLDEYRQGSQFIVVTHNKGTMSACERLYGVTMETKGVSRRVSVSLDDVDRWSEPTPPQALDAESGERVVELVPARGGLEAAGTHAKNGSDGEVSP